ncbi:glycosyltransferase family 2 protein [Vreelandella subglaciescola]|uniref:Glycosyltransferase, GT2 family n=1 Tax=Vreelandella subglaciescola TaxID=29571 RepID=A0A1M7FII8_9GAMM|nr:glycosyltransferase family 2 protein [Halomonas subglaciescola]SHM03793.1 Glycosyltransferase, GT2 family [Halomonas subglaciescola]
MNARTRKRLDKGLRWLARALNQTPLVRRPLSRLKPHRHLRCEENAAGTGFEWQAVGDDPQFRLTRELPLPGWHMLEVAMTHDQPSAAVKLYLDTGWGFNEAQSVYLPMKAGRVSKRLFYVPRPLKALRFDPMGQEGHFTLHHLRMAWLSPWFAHDRLAQRLANMHHEYRDVAKGEVLPALKRRAREEQRDWHTLALADYDATFERRSTRYSYTEWLSKRRRLSPQHVQRVIAKLRQRPLISIVLPVYNPRLEWLRECLDSVLEQHYPHWQLCIADDASSDSEVRQVLAEYAERDARIQVVYRQQNGHICAASNSALELAEGNFVALLDHDDRLSPYALFHVAEALHRHPDAGLLYSDEDKLGERGERFDPHFKPQWNPDLLLAQNYISHLGVYRTGLVREVGGCREGFEGSQDHDLALRVSDRLAPDQIVHIPHVLYHWRAGEGSTALESGEKNYTTEAGLMAVREQVTRRVPAAQVEAGHYPNTYRVRWPLPERLPLVSLLVPTRDGVDILKPCVDAILERTDYPELELLILDNQSTCTATLDYMRDVSTRDARVRVLRWNEPFNYSAINNFGALYARGDILGLVNNDIEPINPDWLCELVRQACRPEIGCVGAKLYYPNDTLQHAGVILGIGGVAGHAHKYFNRNSPGYFTRLNLAQNLSAVTGACLLLRKAVFQDVGGLNEEHLAIAFNDVDLCLKVRGAGYRNLWTPYAELYHHESVSRGADDNAVKRARANAEARYMRDTWSKQLDCDPAYNPNLTLVHEDFSLR